MRLRFTVLLLPR